MKKQLILALLVTMCALTVVAQKNAGIALNAVKTEYGLISGISGTNSNIKVFKGIPFAAPPVGDLRWKAPQPAKKWTGVRKCDAFGASPVQNPPVPFGVYSSEFLIPAEPISEDCLYLNVWTKANSTSEKRPVIVYIYGGGFVSGGGSCPIYDGESMADKGIVFLTINYRVGAFGFFSHPELSKESPYHASGNYAILDQIAALKWVKKNIEAFGGDPNNVTIAGQSAGAMSVNALSASPLAKGYFHKIIAESGASVVKGRFGGSEKLESAEQRGVVNAKSAGAESLSDLRKISAADILKTFKGIGSVIVDGYVLTSSIPDIFAAGQNADVPLLTGWNATEASPSTTITTFAKYQESLVNEYGNDAQLILKTYSATTDAEVAKATQDLTRDKGFGIQNYSWARIQSEKGKSKAYLYFFERQVPATGDLKKYGAFHSGEITYAYDNHKMFNRPWESSDYELAKLMSSYWVNFATKGDPNGGQLPKWTPFDKDEGNVMDFNVKSGMIQHPSYQALEFFYDQAVK